MFVKIGPYVKWFGPYQLCDLLQHVGVSEDKCHQLGEKLADTWVGDFLTWVHEKKSRKIKVRIDNYDVWSMDSTLSYIILPMLKKLQQVKHGYPLVDPEDVPEAMRKPVDPEDFHSQYQEEYWDWVLNEMIWAFEQQVDDDADSEFFDHSECDLKGDFEKNIGKLKVDREGLDAWQKRKNNAFKLFGKYYENLWD